MVTQRLNAGPIPALLWGEPSDQIYLFVHGKMSRKEAAEPLARIAARKGWQTLSFDLPQHGERTDGAALDVFTGIRELNALADYVFSRWRAAALYACSLGACFSLQALADRPFEKALFLSPIVDMAYLADQMMAWFGVTPEALEVRGTVDTPIDVMRWADYQFFKAHPIRRWPIPTAILYGGRDNLQSMDVINAFAGRFHARVTVSPNSEHPFLEKADEALVEAWLSENV